MIAAVVVQDLSPLLLPPLLLLLLLPPLLQLLLLPVQPLLPMPLMLPLF